MVEVVDTVTAPALRVKTPRRPLPLHPRLIRPLPGLDPEAVQQTETQTLVHLDLHRKIEFPWK